MNSITFTDILRWIDKPLLHIGQSPISIGSCLSGLFVFLLFYTLSFVIRKGVIRLLTQRFQIPIQVSYSIRRVIHYGLLTVGVIVAIQVIGFSLTSLNIIFGFLSVGIGFGLKNITSNFISGIILLFERPISIGDIITVDAQANPVVGIVQSIGMRSTSIRTFDNVNVNVPNSQFIESQVINWSYGELRVRLHIPIGVAYGSDTKKITRILLDLADNHPKILKDPKPKVWFMEFADSSLNFELLVWLPHPEHRFDVKSDLNYAIDDAFKKEGVQIPFPQRDIHIKTPTSTN